MKYKVTFLVEKFYNEYIPIDKNNIYESYQKYLKNNFYKSLGKNVKLISDSDLIDLPKRVTEIFENKINIDANAYVESIDRC